MRRRSFPEAPVPAYASFGVWAIFLYVVALIVALYLIANIEESEQVPPTIECVEVK